MSILFIIILFCIVILIYLLIKSMEKNILITVLCSILIVYMLVSPAVCINSAIAGAKLYFYKVFPSLFSFLVISNIMMCFDGVAFYSKLLGNILCRPLRLPKECGFVLMVSMLCGYPLGAKYTCDLYEQGIIDFKTAERLLNIASNTSPLFAVGAVGTAMLSSSYIGYILLFANYLSCFIIGIILPGKNNSKGLKINTNRNQMKEDFGSVLKNSIDNSIKTCLTVGGFVIMFSVINSIIKSSHVFDAASLKLHSLIHIPQSLIMGTSLGFIEMTNGCNLISLESINMSYKIAIIGFFLSFSGISIILQAYSFMYKHNFSLKRYTMFKIIQGLICAVISAALYSLPMPNFTVFTFSSHYVNNTLLLAIPLIILCFPLILQCIKRLFYTS